MNWVFKYALAVCLILGVAGDSLATPSRDLVEAAGIALPVEINLPVIWEDCGGDWNGWYTGTEIHLCASNLNYGIGVAREIYLHELGHAYIQKMHISLARWGGNEEAAADEFAAVMSVVQGHSEDILAKAKLWISHPGGGFPGDPHPSNYNRAIPFVHLYYGYTWPYLVWHAEWAAALAFWRAQV